MTPELAMSHIKENSSLNKVRSVFSNHASGIEQSGMQRVKPTPQESRAMEFIAVVRILEKAEQVGLITMEPDLFLSWVKSFRE